MPPIVKFSGAPKGEMVTCLLGARRQTSSCTEHVLKKAEKFYQLRDVWRLFMYLGNLMLGDTLPMKWHDQPLLRAAFVQRMISAHRYREFRDQL